jgi:hypothetical protein
MTARPSGVQALHNRGRYGLAMFAVSGVEIALWDLAGHPPRRSGVLGVDVKVI